MEVHVEDNNGGHENGVPETLMVEELASVSTKVEKKNGVNGEKVSDSTVAAKAKRVTKPDGLKAIKTKSGGPKGSKNDSVTEVPKASKEHAATAVGNSKIKKAVKDQPNEKGLASSVRSEKPTLSQSLSFPSRGAQGNVMKKSLDASNVKSVSKKPLSNARRSSVKSSESSLTADSVQNNSNGQLSGEVTSMVTIGKKRGGSAGKTSDSIQNHSSGQKSGEVSSKVTIGKKSGDSAGKTSDSVQNHSNGQKSGEVTSKVTIGKKSGDSAGKTSDSVQNHSNGEMPVEVTSKVTVGKKSGDSTGKTSSASAASTELSVSAKNGVSNASAEEPASESSLAVDQSSVTAIGPSSEDGDECLSANQEQGSLANRLSGINGFLFRSDERAEKRKEFNMKIEEKIHAKEAEKSNLQAKSKECLEAELRQLRKSLNFKATPMPTFYKEPPPKVELKKIPITRPVSPKLGRNKSPVNAANNVSDGGASCVSPRVSPSQKRVHANSDKSADTTQTPVRKSQSKLHTRESVGTKKEVKAVKPKAKKEVNKENDSSLEVKDETQSAPQISTEDAVVVNQVEAMETSHDNETTVSTPKAETMPSEIMVGG